MRYEIFTNETIDLSREYITHDGYVPGAHMKLAYTGELPNDSVNVLEHLYEKFNIDHPADYKAHSLSVGDVVVLDGKAFSCRAMGWAELPSFDPTVKNPEWIDTDTYFKNQAFYEAKRKALRS